MRISERVKPNLNNLPLINEDNEGEAQLGVGTSDCVVGFLGLLFLTIFFKKKFSWSYQLIKSSHPRVWEVTIRNLNM